MAYTSTPLTPSVLAQLKENTRLQTSLAEHKIRSDQHRNNFEALRVEHSRLQEVQRNRTTMFNLANKIQYSYTTRG